MKNNTHTKLHIENFIKKVFNTKDAEKLNGEKFKNTLIFSPIGAGMFNNALKEYIKSITNEK